MNRKNKILISILITLHLLVLVAGIYFRFADPDEGGMLLLSKEIINGRIPILDINAHNQPLIYYFYGLWMEVFGFSIISARVLSLIGIFGCGLLLLWWAYRTSGSLLAASILYLLFITNLTFFKANIPVKPFALSNFFLFASFVLLTANYQKSGKLGGGTLFASGLLLGISLGVRLIFIMPVIFFFWILFVLYKDGEGLPNLFKKCSLYTIAVTIPLIPSIIIIIKEPLRAYWIWAGAYAQIYLGKGSNPDFAVDVVKDIKHDMIVQGIMDVIKVPDTTVLFLMQAASVFFLLYKWKCLDKIKARIYLLTLLIFGGIIWVYSNLFANYIGYVNQLVLFSLILLLPLVEVIVKKIGFKKIVVLGAVFMLATTGLLYYHFQNKLKTSIFYVLRSDDTIITPEFVNSLSENTIKKLTKENDIIFDVWGLFVFASGRKPLQGFEYPTDIVFFWNFMPVKEKASKYLFVPEPEVYSKLNSRQIPMVILGDSSELGKLVYNKKLLESHGIDTLREVVEKNYDLYEKHFVKPTNAWILIYLPKGSNLKN